MWDSQVLPPGLLQPRASVSLPLQSSRVLASAPAAASRAPSLALSPGPAATVRLTAFPCPVAFQVALLLSAATRLHPSGAARRSRPQISL